MRRRKKGNRKKKSRGKKELGGLSRGSMVNEKEELEIEMDRVKGGNVREKRKKVGNDKL